MSELQWLFYSSVSHHTWYGMWQAALRFMKVVRNVYVMLINFDILDVGFKSLKPDDTGKVFLCREIS